MPPRYVDIGAPIHKEGVGRILGYMQEGVEEEAEECLQRLVDISSHSNFCTILSVLEILIL